LWGEVGARSRFVLERGVWTGAVLGIVLKYHSCLLTAMSISGLHFDMYNIILENYIIYGLSLDNIVFQYNIVHIKM